MNDTGMKLFSETREEDNQHIADLVIKRMKEKYPPAFENIHGKTPSQSLLAGKTNVMMMIMMMIKMVIRIVRTIMIMFMMIIGKLIKLMIMIMKTMMMIVIMMIMMMMMIIMIVIIEAAR